MFLMTPEDPDIEVPGSATLVELPNGQRSARVGDLWLDDPVDPKGNAGRFVGPEDLRGADTVLLVGGGAGHRVERLRALGVRRIVTLEPFPELRALMEPGGPLFPSYEGTLVAGTLAELQWQVAATFATRESLRVFGSRPYAALFPDLLERCRPFVGRGLAMGEDAYEALQYRARLGAKHTAENVRRLAGTVRVDQLGAPLRGMPAFIVSAGPSLDRNLHLIEEAAKRGPVFAVNTAAKAIEHAQGTVDVLVTIESLPVGDQLSRTARSLLLDISAHASSFEAPIEPKVVTFGLERAQYVADHLGVGEFQTAGNVGTFALQAALNFGADPVVLLGQDCAFPDGRMYASHCQRDMWRARIEGRKVVLECDEALWRLFSEYELPAAQVTERIDLPAWGGAGSVVSNPMFTRIATHLQTVAASRPEYAGRRFINATEGGASLEGWEEKPLEALLAELPERTHGLHEALAEAPRYGAPEVERARRAMQGELRAVERIAGKCLDKRGAAREQAAMKLRAAAAKAPLVNGHAAGRLLTLRREDPPDRARQTFQEIKDSARLLRFAV
ncbi:MAG: 6-hydroxymethylpterin diphosphokinase MptE-like protein [Myxococcota bacterium]